MNNSLRNFARAFNTPVKKEKSKKIFLVICTVQGIQKYAEQNKINFTATLTIGYPLGEEIIEPETEVVDSESIRSGKVLVQSIHPGPQSRPQGIST